MSTSDPAPQPRKRSTKRTTTKKVAAKAQAKPEPKVSPEAAVLAEKVESDLRTLLAGRVAPTIDGPAKVMLQITVTDAATPLDAVNLAIGQIVDEGLTKWAWIVQADKMYVVHEGRVLTDDEVENFDA